MNWIISLAELIKFEEKEYCQVVSINESYRTYQKC
jgi:hypothetical protein